MAEAASCITAASNPFTLTYDQQTNVCLLRYGKSSKEPTRDVLRYRKFRDHSETQQKQYGEGSFEKKDLKRVDLIVDDNGLILSDHKDSSGFSTFTSEKEMSKKLKNIQEQRVWQLCEGTPFPSEMTFHHTPRTGHVAIKPTNPVSPDTFLKMLNCLHWVKVHP